MSEVWKSIVGTDGHYEVSNQGRVRSLDWPVRLKNGDTAVRRGRVLKPRLDGGGYRFVTLSSPAGQVSTKIHRLVALHFLPPSDLPEINHKDLDKGNNAVGNLEWITRRGNAIHARDGGRFSAESNPKRAKKLSVENVAEIRRLQAAGVRYREICGRFGIAMSLVSRIVRLQAWVGHG